MRSRLSVRKALWPRVVVACALLAATAASQPAPCVDGLAAEYECENVDLLGHVSLGEFGSRAGSGHWGWTNPETAREYALMGLDDGTGFVDITDPTRPVYLGKLPAHTDPSAWRELKVFGHLAVIVSEADGHGMQIFDLHRLEEVDRSEAPVQFEPDAHYDAVGHAHNVAAVFDSRTVYIVGNRESLGCDGGLHMVDMRQPMAPTFAGCFADDGYTHDLYCEIYEGPDTRYAGREICVASNEDVVTIVDTTDPSGPVMISQAIYPNIGYTHQGWFTEDRRHFVVNDELDEMRFGFNTRTLIVDLSDLQNPQFVGDHFGPTRAIAHNLYVRGQMVYMANYRRGLEIARIDDAAEASLTNVAFFDSFPEDTATQFGGAWNVYPFYESGTVTIADMNRGLFMVRPRNQAPLELPRLNTWVGSDRVMIEWSSSGSLPARYVVEVVGEEGYDAFMVRATEERSTYRASLQLPPGEHELQIRAVGTDGMSSISAPFQVVVEP